MDIVYLTVPYKDKDIVKALGARWDGKNRQWFVAKESETRFARWIKAKEGEEPEAELGVSQWQKSPMARTAKEEAAEVKPGERVGASLSSVLFEVSEAVRRALPAARWIMAEVASIRTHPHSKHTYVELVEHDESGREIAKANGRIWAGNSKILKRFEKETGGAVAEGMKVLFLAQADFSIQYGFGLTIEDVDPAWTLGEMQRKVVQIRQRLTEEGLLDLNSSMKPAAEFVSVAVVAPDGAAGLGDFMADAKLLIDAGLCKFHFVPAVFEGPSALVSVSSALAIARDMAERADVDAVVVVRGGGAKTSLNWLNEYEMAALICSMPVPVMVGVGHERDATVLDEVACESFDTPSKVVGAIVSRVIGNAQQAKFALTEVKSGVGRACSAATSATLLARSTVESTARRLVAGEGSALDAEMSDIRAACRSDLRDARGSIDSLAREVVGLGPAASLDRGYGVVKQDGVTKGRVSALDLAKPIVLRMADGEITLHVKKGTGK